MLAIIVPFCSVLRMKQMLEQTKQTEHKQGFLLIMRFKSPCDFHYHVLMVQKYS